MYKLTKPQKLIYDMHKFAGGGIAVICGSVLIHGEKDLPCLIAAVNEIYRLNDALRIRIMETEDGTRQAVCDFKEQDVETLRFETREEFNAYAKTYAIEPLDLYGSLCDIRIVTLNDRYGILVKLHHIVGDAWTLSLLGSQFCTLVNGETPEAYSYTQYIEREEAYLQSARYQRDRAFFLEQFKECDEVTYLSDKQSDLMESKRRTFVMDKEQAARINAYAEKNNTSAFVLFMSAFAVYMNRTKMNAERFYLGTAVLNRAGARDKNTMGMFINSAPILMRLDNEASFAENLAAIQQSSFSVFRHQKYNYGDVLTDIRKEYGFTEKLYDVMLSYQNAAITGADGTFESTWYHSGAQTESLQIHIDDRDSESVFRIHFDYQVEKFAEPEIEKLYGHFTNLLFDAIGDDGKKLYELKILPEAEKNKLIYEFNDTAADYPRDKCVHQLFEEQAQKTPDKTAVIACDQTLTYAQLNEQANRIAHGLIEQGVKMGDIVAFALPRKSYLISAIFGILKAGAAYLPIDPDFPEERIRYMLEDSGAKLFVTVDRIEELLAVGRTDNPGVTISSEDLCYCIYTSGSTGMPKSVLIRHRNLVNFCNNNNKNIHSCMIKYETRILSTFKVCFDAFGVDYALFLLNGHSMVLADEDNLANPQKLAGLIPRYNIDVIHSTPAIMTMLCKCLEYSSALQHIKVITIAAERFERQLYEIIKSSSDAMVLNGYGPTETTIGACFGEISTIDITIGKPIANTQIHIVDKYMHLAPIGTTGELCIAGDGVGAGYLNRPELTAEKFVDNPFGEGKLYKTGDLAYWREDGNIVYVGRNDFQVKIRGLRIELGEIESAICSVPGVSQAVIVVRKDEAGRQTICAFYTESTPVSVEQIKSALRERLPRYMLPHIFTVLPVMPLTSSGKINRKALPEVDLGAGGYDSEYVKPEGALEKHLAQTMAEVLGYSPVGRNDDFFDLGGDSLKAIEFVSKAYSEGIYFALQNVFDHPTVKKLAEYIENGNKHEVSYDDIDFTKVNRLLAKNNIDNIITPTKEPVGDILLAGATGYLGIHILADYLEHDSGMAYCLVRGEDEADSKRRFAELLQFYFGDKYNNSDRITIICADLQKEHFGLGQEEYSSLLSKVDTVINAAASVKHYGSYKYFHETNVETVSRLIDFCKKADVKLIHTSTLSVSGNSFGDHFDGYVSETEKHFYESSLYIGQALDNVYARSKFEAERAVLDAMGEGLRANIMRMGNLTNRLSDGVFQKNHESNAFLKRVKAILEMGVFPEYLLPIYAEFTPIDEAANAVMTIARYFSDEYTVFHINSTKVYYMDRLVDYFNELGHEISVVDGKAFTVTLRKTMEQSGMEHIFETFINDMDEQGQLNYDSNIRIENDFTVEYLKRLGFEWSEPGIDYLRKYLSYFKNIGYLEGKQNV